MRTRMNGRLTEVRPLLAHEIGRQFSPRTIQWPCECWTPSMPSGGYLAEVKSERIRPTQDVSSSVCGPTVYLQPTRKHRTDAQGQRRPSERPIGPEGPLAAPARPLKRHERQQLRAPSTTQSEDRASLDPIEKARRAPLRPTPLRAKENRNSRNSLAPPVSQLKDSRPRTPA